MAHKTMFAAVLALLLLGGAFSASGQGRKDQLRARDGQICQEVQSGRMWQIEKQRGVATAREAELYAAGLRLGGYDDWRLPTKAEMFDLAAIFFWHRNTDCKMNTRGDFWVVGDSGDPAPGHWEIDFACGPENHYIEAIQPRGHVRAVRP